MKKKEKRNNHLLIPISSSTQPYTSFYYDKKQKILITGDVIGQVIVWYIENLDYQENKTTYQAKIMCNYADEGITHILPNPSDDLSTSFMALIGSKGIKQWKHFCDNQHKTYRYKKSSYNNTTTTNFTLFCPENSTLLMLQPGHKKHFIIEFTNQYNFPKQFLFDLEYGTKPILFTSNYLILLNRKKKATASFNL